MTLDPTVTSNKGNNKITELRTILQISFVANAFARISM